MKQQNDIPDPIDDLLGSIEQVEVSPFLLTRIHAELEAQRQENLPVTWAWLGTACLALLLILNVWTIQQYNNNELSASTLVEALNLNLDNGFYNE